MPYRYDFAAYYHERPRCGAMLGRGAGPNGLARHRVMKEPRPSRRRCGAPAGWLKRTEECPG